jgi:uncharacterized membrane protein YeaQ/YmgE (transglycosylase-associated protein family)
MALLWILFIGLIIGAVAKLIMPGKDPGGILITAAIGVAGSLVATFIGKALGLYEPDQAAGFIGAVIGSVLLLAGYRAIRG